MRKFSVLHHYLFTTVMRTTTFVIALVFSFGGFAQQQPDNVVYPNPATDELYVPVSDDVAEVRLHDLLGNPLASEKRGDRDTRKVFRLALPSEQFPSGVYLVDRRDMNDRAIDCHRFRIMR